MSDRVADIREIVRAAKEQHAPVYPQFRALGDIAYLLDTLEAVEKAMVELPPLDWEPDDGYGDYNDYPLKDGRLSSVDSTNSGDVHCHGIAVGEQAVHKKLRAILEGGER